MWLVLVLWYAGELSIRRKRRLITSFPQSFGTAGKVKTADFRRTIYNSILKLLKSSFLNFALLD